MITLVGSTPIDVEAGSVYIDAGATAFDDGDGDVTASIVTVNPVDTSTLGTYTVTYTVTDSSGWQVDTITFFAYQTGSTTTSTFTEANLQIWDGDPSAGGTVTVDEFTDMVVLTYEGEVETWVAFDGSGNLVVTDVNNETADSLTVSRSFNELVIEDTSGVVLGTVLAGATMRDANTVVIDLNDAAITSIFTGAVTADATANNPSRDASERLGALVTKNGEICRLGVGVESEELAQRMTIAVAADLGIGRQRAIYTRGSDLARHRTRDTLAEALAFGLIERLRKYGATVRLVAGVTLLLCWPKRPDNSRLPVHGALRRIDTGDRVVGCRCESGLECERGADCQRGYVPADWRCVGRSR